MRARLRAGCDVFNHSMAVAVQPHCTTQCRPCAAEGGYHARAAAYTIAHPATKLPPPRRDRHPRSKAGHDAHLHPQPRCAPAPGFALLDLNSSVPGLDTLYVCDDQTSTTNGGGLSRCGLRALASGCATLLGAGMRLRSSARKQGVGAPRGAGRGTAMATRLHARWVCLPCRPFLPCEVACPSLLQSTSL